MSVSNQVLETALAALLRSIGRVYQRSGVDTLSNENGNDYREGTRAFINQNRGKLEKVVTHFSFNDFVDLATTPTDKETATLDQQLVGEAEIASMGMDEELSLLEEKPGAPLRALDSLFSQVIVPKQNTTDNITPPYQGQYALKRESYFASSEEEVAGKASTKQEFLFPQRNLSISQKDYQKLWDSFLTEFEKLDDENAYRFLESFKSLFTRFFQTVPTTMNQKLNDIPLPDHAVTTAAIAAALAKSKEDLGESFDLKKASFLWVVGDFGGIQKFIFTVRGESTKFLAKLLRGRSFAVNMLNILAARMITDACGVPSLNALSLAGGKFQILLPNTPQTVAAFSQAKEKIEQWIFQEFFGEIRIYIDEGTCFNIEDFSFKENRFKEKVIAKSFISLNQEKKRVFYRQLTSSSDWVNSSTFENIRSSHSLCTICAAEEATSEERGAHCKQFILFGQQLTKSKFLALFRSNKKSALLGEFDLQFFTEEESAFKEAHAIYGINSQENLQERFPHLDYAAYTPPFKDNDEKSGKPKRDATFDHLAKKSEGLSALAVLKADVDNLGFIFTKGLDAKDSVSRRRALSRLFDHFFTGYLPALLKKSYPYVYTLFAGGDDLCLIGPWDKMISLAEELQKQFHRYVAENSNITISAGITLFHVGAPVSRSVEACEEFLERSKSGGRNRITLFDQTMEWKEIASQQQFVADWEAYLNASSSENDNRNTMLYRFLQYWKTWKESDAGSIDKLKHRFHFIYDINRNVDKAWREKAPFKDLVKTKDPKMEDNSTFKNLGVGLSIAMYKKR